jgi:hypothetical protein
VPSEELNAKDARRRHCGQEVLLPTTRTFCAYANPFRIGCSITPVIELLQGYAVHYPSSSSLIAEERNSATASTEHDFAVALLPSSVHARDTTEPPAPDTPVPLPCNADRSSAHAVILPRAIEQWYTGGNSMPDLKDQIEQEMSGPAEKKPAIRDTFKEDWEETKQHWRRIHAVYDYAWLFYNSVVFINNLYGEQWLEAFGLQVAVPRTFMTIESIASQMLNRKIEFEISGRTFRSFESAKYNEKLMNAEWQRSQADRVLRECEKDALIYGNGYGMSVYVDDTKDYHFLKTEDEGRAPDDPEDGVPDVESIKTAGELNWITQPVVEYRGVKLRRCDPYYTFTDPYATDDDSRRFVYYYGTLGVEEMRDFVVAKGWLTREEADVRIQPTSIERFDAIRNQLDTLYNMPISPWTRTDNDGIGSTANKQMTEPQDRNRVAFIERYERDHYEIRLVNEDVALYEDFNIYPHKKIPITTFWDVKVPGEFRGRGEPEIIRYQQIEENKIHNLMLQAALMAVVQRYAINPALLEDESDANFHNPFKPLRLKALPGNDVSKAIQPMQQPDIKSGPFKLMDLVKEIIQQTTGASDFVLSASDASTDTATESENLVQASAARIRSKLVSMEEGLEQISQMWIASFSAFYNEEMDLKLTGKNEYFRYLPYDSSANEDASFIQDTAGKLGVALPQPTLRAVYKALGYKDVVFASDLIGQYDSRVKITDIDVSADRAIDKYLKAIKVMSEANTAAANMGDKRRFDVFKLSMDMVRQFPFIENVDEYMQAEPEPTPPEESQSPITEEPPLTNSETALQPTMTEDNPI